jgi:phosphoribosylamine---glycine ligase
VLAAAGYPGTVRTGSRIYGLDAALPPQTKVFHAASETSDATIVASGGRVLTVCARGDDIEQARERAYAAAAQIRFDGMFYRRDIGFRALARSGE